MRIRLSISGTPRGREKCGIDTPRENKISKNLIFSNCKLLCACVCVIRFSREDLEIRLLLNLTRLSCLLKAAVYRSQERRGRLAFMFSCPQFFPLAAVVWLQTQHAHFTLLPVEAGSVGSHLDVPQCHAGLHGTPGCPSGALDAVPEARA